LELNYISKNKKIWWRQRYSQTIKKFWYSLWYLFSWIVTLEICWGLEESLSSTISVSLKPNFLIACLILWCSSYSRVLRKLHYNFIKETNMHSFSYKFMWSVFSFTMVECLIIEIIKVWEILSNLYCLFHTYSFIETFIGNWLSCGCTVDVV
jgi:hypothetical protein